MHTPLCVCVCVCVMGREGLVGVQASWQDLDTQNHEKQPGQPPGQLRTAPGTQSTGLTPGVPVSK